MELRHLRYFCAVGEAENFGRAARKLAIAQPALSRQIRDLEHEMGLQLFERLPRGVRLSQAGKSALADAQRILTEVAAMTERARALDRGDVGTLRIGFSESVSANGPMPRSCQAFRAERPNVSLELHPLSSIQQLQLLEEREIDAGFIYHVPELHPGFETLAVERNEVILAVPSSHCFAGAADVRLRDLENEPMVWIRRSTAPATYDQQMRACLARGFSPRIALEEESEPRVLSLVATGAGVAFVTSINFERCPSTVSLRRMPDLALAFRVDLVWRSDNKSPVLAPFIEIVTRLAQPDAATNAASGAP